MCIEVLVVLLLVAVFVLGASTRAGIRVLGPSAAIAPGGSARGESATEILAAAIVAVGAPVLHTTRRSSA